MSSNYPPGVSQHTFGAPWNDITFEFSVGVDVVDNDDKCLGQFDDYVFEEQVDEHVKRYICYGGVVLPGPSNYGDNDILERAKREYLDYDSEILWEQTFEVL